MSKILVIIVISIFLFPNLASAKDNEPLLPNTDDLSVTQLGITPSIFENVVKPGETSKSIFQFTNKSLIPIPIKAYVRTFDASDEKGGVNITEDPDLQRFSITSWTSIVEPDFIIQPGAARRVNVVFSPPKDLPPGGYYGILFFEPLLPESFLSQSSLQIGGRIGALLFIVSAGDIKESGRIKTFSTNYYQWKRQSIHLSLRFQNLGNIHLRPQGKIIITNAITKRQQTIETAQFTVLPGKIRQEFFNLSQLKWPGLYKAQVSLNYGREKSTSQQQVTFIYFPLIYPLGITLILAFLWLVLSAPGRARLARAGRIIIRGR